jgi:hypothetical protein
MSEKWERRVSARTDPIAEHPIVVTGAMPEQRKGAREKGTWHRLGRFDFGKGTRT